MSATGSGPRLPTRWSSSTHDWRIRSFNHAAEELYGWEEGEVIGRSLNDVIPLRVADAVIEAATRLLQHAGYWHGRVVQGHRSGDELHVLTSTTLLTDTSGKHDRGDLGQPGDHPASRLDHAALAADPGLPDEIRRGLVNDEFIVHYQPIVRLDDGTPVGVEALARWNHPTKGLLAPAEFIDAAERHGLIGEPRRRCVLRQACAQARRWRDAGLDLYMSVNVSACQLADELLPSRLADILAETGLRPSDLWIEVTETALVEDLGQARKGIQGDLRARGSRVDR